MSDTKSDIMGRLVQNSKHLNALFACEKKGCDVTTQRFAAESYKTYLLSELRKFDG